MSRSAGGICGSWDNSTFNIAVKRHLVNLRETRKYQRTKGSLTEYIGARSEAGCVMHYFERGVELSVAKYVCRQITSVGEARWGRGWTEDYASTLLRGLVVGDVLWLVVIAFLFAAITGVFG